MKTTKFNAYISILGIVLILVSCQTSIPNKEAKVSLLKEVGYSIDIDPVNENYSDLEFLKGKIGDAEIVMLGEIAHSDGSSLLAKSRLVKFLHTEMGFDVVVFESGLFDCNYSWRLMKEKKTSADSAFAQGVFQVWSKSEAVSQLVEYLGLKANSDHPLELAGFDIQPTGDLKPEYRRAMIYEQLKSIDRDLDTAQFKQLNLIFNDPKHIISIKEKKDSVSQNELYKELGQIKQLCIKTDLTKKKNKIFLRYIQNLERFFYFTFNIDYNNIRPEIANIRDEEMAKNLIWLKKQLYSDKKIIVWGANSHLINNRELLFYKDKMVPMGQLVKDYFADKVHIIGLTCYSGELGSIAQNKIFPVPLASNKSIEYLIHSAGFEYAYFDSHDLANSPIIDSIFVARFLGFTNQKAVWNNMFDSFIFIDKMMPNTIKKQLK